jgi:hypothetical protein
MDGEPYRASVDGHEADLVLARQPLMVGDI